LNRTLPAIAAMAALLMPFQATAQATCRPDRLGNSTCLGAPSVREHPKTPFEPAPGLSGPKSRAPVLIPERRTNSFGDLIVGPQARPDPAVRPNPRCRTDSFGNLRCP
jgi:hypothetical protein